MAIGLMKLYPIEALTSAGVDSVEASAIAGTAMAVFFSVANGIGRIAWGALSDTLGRKRSVVIMAGTQGIFLAAFIPMAGNEYLLYLAAALIGFNYGGVLGDSVRLPTSPGGRRRAAHVAWIRRDRETR